MASATTEIYTLSLHAALPISSSSALFAAACCCSAAAKAPSVFARRCVSARRDRKSTRLNSSHRTISYAVFCLKNKNERRDRGLQRHGQEDADAIALADA